MHIYTHHKSTTQLMSLKNHHLHKAHVERSGCPNAPLIYPKLPYLHLNHNRDHPVVHPLENLTHFHHLQYFVDPQLYHSPTALYIIFLICSLLGSRIKVMYKLFLDFLDCPIVPSASRMCATLREIKRISWTKPSIPTWQYYTLCNSILSHATLILYYHASMLTLQNSVISRALWLPQVWYYGVWSVCNNNISLLWIILEHRGGNVCSCRIGCT